MYTKSFNNLLRGIEYQWAKQNKTKQKYCFSVNGFQNFIDVSFLWEKHPTFSFAKWFFVSFSLTKVKIRLRELNRTFHFDEFLQII